MKEQNEIIEAIKISAERLIQAQVGVRKLLYNRPVDFQETEDATISLCDRAIDIFELISELK